MANNYLQFSIALNYSTEAQRLWWKKIADAPNCDGVCISLHDDVALITAEEYGDVDGTAALVLPLTKS